MNARVHGKAHSLSYQAKVTFEQLISLIKGSFFANGFHEITGITYALKKDAHDQNEQTICLFMQTVITHENHLDGFFLTHAQSSEVIILTSFLSYQNSPNIRAILIPPFTSH